MRADDFRLRSGAWRILGGERVHICVRAELPQPARTMIDAIKKTLLAGIGAAVITKEKAEAALHDLVKQGKISTADARIMADKIAEQGRREFEDMSGRLNDRLREFVHHTDQNFRTRIDLLEDRVRRLEEKLADSPPSSNP